MEAIYAIVGIVVGSLLTFAMVRLLGATESKSLRERLTEKDSQAEKASKESSRLQTALLEATSKRTALEAELKAKEESFDDQLAAIEKAETVFANAFAVLSQSALKKSSEQFLQLARENFEKHSEGASGDLKLRQLAIEELVKPLKETLEKLDKQTQEIEQKRASAYDGVTEHINRLVAETSLLSSALRKPHVRGSWGELTLRKVAESAGLIEGQDFTMQFSTDTDEGRLRPDMIVNLPNHGVIVVDSKVPLDSYLDAMNATDDETRIRFLKGHSVQVRKHIQQLSSKSYWSQFDRSPDFVIMFVPSESLYQAALEQDVELLEAAFKARVVLANPMTLIALMRTVAYGMTQEKVRENALEIRAVGEKLYDSVRTFASHMTSIGRHLSQTNDSFNRAVGSMERNVLSKARQLKSLGAGAGDDLESPDVISLAPRLPLGADDKILVEPNDDKSGTTLSS